VVDDPALVAMARQRRVAGRNANALETTPACCNAWVSAQRSRHSGSDIDRYERKAGDGISVAVPNRMSSVVQPPSASSMRRALLWIFAVALVLRLVAIPLEATLQLGGHVSHRFVTIAMNILNGHGYSDAPGVPNVFDAPVYQYVLAALFAVFGESLTAVKVFQAALDSLTACAACLLAARLFASARAGITAGFLYAIFPLAIYLVADVAPETLFTLLLTLTALALVHAVQTGRRTHYIVTGVLLGLTTLTRPTTLYLLPFLTVPLLALRVTRRTAVHLAILSFPSFVLTIVPWTIRNYLVTGEVVPVAVGGPGEVLLQGSHPDFFTIDGKNRNYIPYFERLKEKGIVLPPNHTDMEWDRFTYLAAREMYAERWRAEGPLGLGAFFLHKFGRLWYATESGAHHLLSAIMTVPFLLLAVGGMITGWKHGSGRAARLPLFGIVAYFVLLHWITLPLVRYMIPVFPLLIAHAGYWLAARLPASAFVFEPSPSTFPVGESSRNLSIAE
jgi:4-amino-4-deoxy-L-arabinose transferase-like glycosyltransferase